MKTTYIIGRKGDIKLNDRAVSRQHAKLVVSKFEIYIKDLGSVNGIFLVKNNRLIRFYEGYVQINQSVVIGSQQYTIAELIDKAAKHAA